MFDTDSPLIHLVREHPEYVVNYADFSEIQEIGQSMNATVFLSQHQLTGRTVALKKFSIQNGTLNEQEEASFSREIEMLLKINSPLFLKLVGFTASAPFCIVTEYIPNGSLFDAIKHKEGSPELNGTMLTVIAYFAALGFKLLHDNAIVHGNINASNILLDNECRPHIVDFSCAKLSETRFYTPSSKGYQTVNQSIGYINWQAPEVLSTFTTTIKSDIYSFGMMLYEMLTGFIPFEGYDSNQIQSFVLAGQRPPFPEGIPMQIQSIIQKCWSQNPDERPSLNDITQMLKKHKVCFPGCNYTQFDQLIQGFTAGGVQINTATPVNSISPNIPQLSPRSSTESLNQSNSSSTSIPSFPSIPSLNDSRQSSFIEICPQIQERNRRRSSGAGDPFDFSAFSHNQDHKSQFEITPQMRDPTDGSYDQVIIDGLSRVPTDRFFDFFLLIANNFKQTSVNHTKTILTALEQTLLMNEDIASIFMSRNLYTELPLLDEKFASRNHAIVCVYFRQYQNKITLDFINMILAMFEQKMHANLLVQLNKITHETNKTMNENTKNMKNFEEITEYLLKYHQSFVKKYEQIAFISLIFIVYINSFKESQPIYLPQIINLEHSFIVNTNDPIVNYFGYKAMLDFHLLTKNQENENNQIIVDSNILEKHLQNEVLSQIATLYILNYSSRITITPTLLKELFTYLKNKHQKVLESEGQFTKFPHEKQEIENAIISLFETHNDSIKTFLDINEMWLNDQPYFSSNQVIRILQKCFDDEEIKAFVGNLPNLGNFFKQLVLSNDQTLISFIYPIIARLTIGLKFIDELSENQFLIQYLQQSIATSDVQKINSCLLCAERIARVGPTHDFLAFITAIPSLLSAFSNDQTTIRACVSLSYDLTRYNEFRKSLINASIVTILSNYTQYQELLPYIQAITQQLQ